MRIVNYRPSRRAVFWTLMSLSALTVLMPPRLTDGAKHGTQLLVPLQDVVYFLTFRGSRSIDRIGDPEGENRAQVEALRRELAAQSGLIQQLKSENEELAAVRDRSIPLALRAHVVARDIVQWRDSLLIERGSKLGVNPQDWIASRLFLDRGGAHDVNPGAAVITREVLLGRVEEVSPYMSRVCLFSDPSSDAIKVRVGGFVDNRFDPVDYPCSLRGRGRSEMIIKNVDYRHVEKDVPSEPKAEDGAGGDAEQPLMPARQRGIRVGDYVYSAPGQLGLPSPMVIGRVREIVEDPSQRLVYDVIVEPAVALDEVRAVSIIPLIPTNVAME